MYRQYEVSTGSSKFGVRSSELSKASYGVSNNAEEGFNHVGEGFNNVGEGLESSRNRNMQNKSGN